MADIEQQQVVADASGGAASATAHPMPSSANSQPQADSQNGHKSKQPIKYVPPKPAPGNPNFGPKKAWPGGNITVKYPKNAPPPGTHRWKGNNSQMHHQQQQQQPGRGGAMHPTSKPYGSSRFRTASGSHGGGINMHSAVALQLQSAVGSRGRAPSSSAGAGSQNDHLSGSGGSGEAPEPGEVPVGLRRRVQSHTAGLSAAASGIGAAAAARGSGLAQLYKQQQGSGSLLEALTQRRGSGGSPRNSPGHAPGGSERGSFQRPSGGSPAFAEGYGMAGKLLAALEHNALQLANSHAAVIAAHPPGEEANALRHGFKSRIRRQQQDYADNPAYVAELDEYLAAAFGRGDGDDVKVTSAAAVRETSFSFGVDSPGFGGSVAAADDAWAAGDTRRGVGVLRHGSRRVEVVGGSAGGGAADRKVSGGVDDGRMAGSLKGYKRNWQPDSDAGATRKVVAVGGGGGGGNPKFVKPTAAKAQSHKKQQPPAAVQQAPASVQQKLGMSLDAIAGKPANPKPAQQPTVKAAAVGGGSGSGGAAAGGAAAAGGSRKHTPIAWQA